MKKYNDREVEIIADLFSAREEAFVSDFGDDKKSMSSYKEWILSHAFQIGFKTAQSLISANKK